MPNAFIRKLEGFGLLSEEHKTLLEDVSSSPRLVEADTDLISEGDKPEDVQLIMEGLAVRYKVSRAGDRQIFAYLVAGDFCDLHVALLRRMDHSIGTLTPCQVVRIPNASVLKLVEGSTMLARAFWWCTLVDEAILREWLVNVGGRPAEQRIAHLFCELHARLKAVGRTADGSFHLPLSQAELADTVGMSNVHVNRTLMALKDAGLVTFRGHVVTVPDTAKLEAFAEFDPSYLHRDRQLAPA